MSALPQELRDLIESGPMAHLSTINPDGAPQVNPMWFKFDGELIWFTHTNYRQKFKNIAHEPRVSISMIDPDGVIRAILPGGEYSVNHMFPSGPRAIPRG